METSSLKIRSGKLVYSRPEVHCVKFYDPLMDVTASKNGIVNQILEGEGWDTWDDESAKEITWDETTWE